MYHRPQFKDKLTERCDMNQIAGLHLLVDGYVTDPSTLEPEPICNLFDKLVPALGMQYLMKPVAMRVPFDPSKLQTDDDEGGWSVLCQITTSHISLHGWPKRKAFMMDVFSCRSFSIDLALHLIREILGVDQIVTHVIERRGPISEDTASLIIPPIAHTSNARM